MKKLRSSTFSAASVTTALTTTKVLPIPLFVLKANVQDDGLSEDALGADSDNTCRSCGWAFIGFANRSDILGLK